MGAESSRAIIECKKSDGTILDVHGQRLGEVDRKLLGKFPGLLQLNLSDNGLKYLPTDITKLQKLEKLFCASNELVDLPNSAANLTCLKELDLSSNRLRAFPQEIRQHTLLRVLRLANNQIVEVPPLRMPKLVSLSLANNALPLLPSATISLLTSLTNLNVERNQFSFWPIAEGISLQNLQSLNVSYNGIALVPPTFVDTCLQLTELRLAETQIDHVPSSISRLTKLTVIDVSGNALRSFEPLLALRNLEKLLMNRNQITSLDGVSVLGSLSRLEVGSNKLTALPAETTALRSLECLHFESNSVVAFPVGLFLVATRLTELVLHHNPVVELPEEITRLSSLEVLDVSATQVGALSTSVVTMPSLKTIKYDGSQKPPHLQAAPSRKLLRSTSSNAVGHSAVSKHSSEINVNNPPSTSVQAKLDLSPLFVGTTRVRASSSSSQPGKATDSPLPKILSDSTPSPSPKRRHTKEKAPKNPAMSSSTPLVPSMPERNGGPIPSPSSSPSVNTQALKADSSSSSSSYVYGQTRGPSRLGPSPPTNSISPRKDPSKGSVSGSVSGSGSGSSVLKNSGLNLAATAENLKSANVGDVRRLKMYLAEGREAWLDEFRTAEGLANLLILIEIALQREGGTGVALADEAIECFRVWPTERVDDLLAVKGIFTVLCLVLAPVSMSDDSHRVSVTRLHLHTLRLLSDLTKANTTPQPLLDGLQALQEKLKLQSRFQALASLLSGPTGHDLSSAGLTLINALLVTPDEVDLRSKLRAEIEAAGIRPLLLTWRTMNDSSMRLQLRNYAEAVEFDETSGVSSARNLSVPISPRNATDAQQLRIFLVSLQKTISVPLDSNLTLGGIRVAAASHGLADASEYALYIPHENVWLREESCLINAAVSSDVQRVELRLLPWTFRLSVSGSDAAETTTVDPHLTCAQLLASLIRQYLLPADAEYELLYLENNGTRTPLDPTDVVQRYGNLRKREGQLVLKRVRRDLRIELPNAIARSGSHIRRVSGNVPLKEQIASLASEGFLPAGEIAFWRESSGDWVNAEALDELDSSDVLRLTAKPREVTVTIPPSNKKVVVNVATTEQPQTVINRLVSRYFNRDASVAQSLMLVNVTLGVPLVDGKTLRDQGFEPHHELAAMEKSEEEGPIKAHKSPSNVLDDPAGILAMPEPSEIVMKGTELQAASLSALLRYLTEDVSAASREGPAFLMCYRSVCTPYPIMQRLFERYKSVTNGSAMATDKVRVRDAVAAIVVCWLESYPEEFESDQSLIRVLTDLNRFVKEEPCSPTPAAQLQEACAIAMTGSKAHRRLGNRTQLYSGDLVAKAAKMHGAGSSIGSRLLEADATEVARQLTRLDSADYWRVRSLELLHQAWNGEKREKLAPHITALINRFNLVAGLITETVLLQQKLRHRVKAMSYVIKIAMALRELNNYWSLMAVISGLSHSSITRLRWTLKKLPNSAAHDFEQLKALMSPSENWKAYRAAIAVTRPPCIPYLGVYFQDLVFTDDGNPDHIRLPGAAALINFSKHKQLYASVSALRQFQRVAYDIEEVDDVATLVSAPFVLMSEDRQHAMSLEREPRNADISDVQ